MKAIFAALKAIARTEVKARGKFIIPKFIILKVKTRPARRGGRKPMFGEGMFDFCDVDAKKVVKAYPSESLCCSVLSWGRKLDAQSQELFQVMFQELPKGCHHELD